MEEPFVGGVSNRPVLRTPQVKLNMWLHPKFQKKLSGLKKFLLDLHVMPSEDWHITLYCDNNGVVAQSKEPRPHKR